MPYYLHLNKVYRIGFLFSHISHMNNRLLRRKFCLLGMGNFWDLCVFQDCKGSEGPFLSACQVPVKSYPLLNFQKGHKVSNVNTLQKSKSLLTRLFHMTGNRLQRDDRVLYVTAIPFSSGIAFCFLLHHWLLLGNPHSHKLLLIHCLLPSFVGVPEVNIVYISFYLQLSKTC